MYKTAIGTAHRLLMSLCMTPCFPHRPKHEWWQLLYLFFAEYPINGYCTLCVDIKLRSSRSEIYSSCKPIKSLGNSQISFQRKLLPRTIKLGRRGSYMTAKPQKAIDVRLTKGFEPFPKPAPSCRYYFEQNKHIVHSILVCNDVKALLEAVQTQWPKYAW